MAALLSLLAALGARALAPALGGVWVGTDALVAWVDLAAAVLAQCFALYGLAVMLGQTILLARSGRPVALRALGVGVAGLVAMAMASSMFVVLPEMSGLVAGIGAAAFALTVAVWVGRHATTWLGVVLGACAAAGVVRMGSWALLEWLRAGTDDAGLESLAAVGAAAAALFDLLALVVALGWLAGPGPRLRPGRVLLALLALTLAGGWSWLTWREPAPDALGIVVWLDRALDRLVVGPTPWLPDGGRVLVEATAATVAAAALARPAPGRLGAAMVPLALVSRMALEAPACALSLLLGAMLLALEVGASARPLASWRVEP